VGVNGSAWEGVRCRVGEHAGNGDAACDQKTIDARELA
jgi:hypothetical protein